MEARLSKLSEDAFVQWQPNELRCLLSEELDLGKKFLQINFGEFFSNFDIHWITFLSNLGLSVRINSILPIIDFPGGLDYLWPVSLSCCVDSQQISDLNNEFCLFGIRSDLYDVLTSCFASNLEAMVSDLLAEYLLCRLIGSLSRAWTGTNKIDASILPTDAVQSATILSAIEVCVVIDNIEYNMYFGLSEPITRFFEYSWMNLSSHESAPKISLPASSSVLSVELCELFIPQSKVLLDYITEGAIIDTGMNFNNVVSIKLAGRKLAQGKLYLYRQNFVVHITNILEDSCESDPAVVNRTDAVSLTKIAADISTIQLPRQNKTILSCGSLFTCKEQASNRVSLIINKEVAAYGVIGTLPNNRFAIMVC